MPNQKISQKWLMMGFITAISTIIVVFLTTALNIYLYANNSHHIKADAAIILGAAVWNNQPSPVFQERINHGINLYKNADVTKLIFTGGVGEINELSEAVVGKNYAVTNGVKVADILMETRSRTTYQNLKNALAVASGQNLTKFLIVSDPLHLKRSVFMAKQLGMDAYPSPTPTTRYRSFRSQIEFLLRETYFYLVFLVFKI
ncbi:YdcF family protein [Nostoc sp. FACHB-110]|uniref:YdcF family protein n=1 Tax=Nostoc sp. FACHB-110 TaxID=2692834 RepID=UPI001685E51B|nr:YdcF family protein [Nostoc sp. FACHB-110]MBD2438680.1 YdcF family protein [Nostoc sp. FACHB-110]